jgi:hypothetical protein
VRFVWPAERYDRLTRSSLLTATAITACASAAISLPILTIYEAADRTKAPFDADHVESVTFVQRAPAVVTLPTVRAARPSQPATRTPKRVERVLNADTSSFATARVAPTVPTEPTPSAAASEAATIARPLGTVAAPAAVANSSRMTEAERDRRLNQVAPPLPWIANLPPTKAQIDSAGRDFARRAEVARDDHRPMAIPLGGVAVPLPWGPSVEQRRRDSAINADNLQRLARLAARAKAKRDSMLGANTLARRTDSTHPAKPDST